nr:MAG TPA: hypothetical protein [Caudoviricetes sp.]
MMTLKAPEVQAFIHFKRYGRSTNYGTKKTVAIKSTILC